MLHASLVTTHVAIGTVSLVLGPLAMRDDVRRFAAGTRSTGGLNAAYLVAVLIVCATATGLVVENRPDLWFLIPVSVLTAGLGALAGISADRRFRGWSHGYVHGIGGSYIALVTALVVVELTVDGPVTGSAQLVVWLAPTVIGTPLIEFWRRRIETATSTPVTNERLSGRSPCRSR